MVADIQALESQLLTLSPQEQLRMARWLIDRAVGTLDAPSEQPGAPASGLLTLVGRFSGGPGNSAEQVEAFLESEWMLVMGSVAPDSAVAGYRLLLCSTPGIVPLLGCCTNA